ncbi:hypothetical protein MKW92_024077, partial [Papaver armeniacum]
MAELDSVTEDLEKLADLSLLSKVCTELESHLGFTDKVLAEFIIGIGSDAESFDEFDNKLKSDGAEMPDYFIRTLFTIIRAILQTKSLSIAYGKARVKELEREIEKEARDSRDGGRGGRDAGRDGEADYRSGGGRDRHNRDRERYHERDDRRGERFRGEDDDFDRRDSRGKERDRGSGGGRERGRRRDENEGETKIMGMK